MKGVQASNEQLLRFKCSMYQTKKCCIDINITFGFNEVDISVLYCMNYSALSGKSAHPRLSRVHLNSNCLFVFFLLKTTVQELEVFRTFPVNGGFSAPFIVFTQLGLKTLVFLVRGVHGIFCF